MPRSTFYNLPQDRQEEIIRTCFEEFTSHAYENASVSRIVLKLGIAKGSFYRYFESKKELYLFLIDQATALRMEHVKELFELQAADFFALLEQHLILKIRFDLSFPLLSAFLHNTHQERSNEESADLLIRSKEMLIELLVPVIEKYQKKGVLRTDIRKDCIAHSIIQIQMGINDFLMFQYNTAFQKNINEQKEVCSIPEQEIQSTVKEFSKVLAHGLAVK